jgi:diaminohydroxyphosphoribosylaminopyrimidine deaminase/5-amino-6-(5-phosphoribosylamino)uracil reductase
MACNEARKASPDDEAWMRRAIALARRGEGSTRPNPPVGAVIVRDSLVVGEGWHVRAGGPHAEVAALRRAGSAAKGATLYVTLEPCSTHGRTPPCTDAVAAAGIARVVAATVDPNPAHRGRGLAILRRRGIRVTTGVCGSDARRLIDPFASLMLRKRPFLTLKLAMTLDARIADFEGNSKWISGPHARKIVQDLRGRVDAILVGVDTIIRDDPSLTCRARKNRAPYRVVADTSCRIPLSARVLTDGRPDLTIVAATDSAASRRTASVRKTGASVVVLAKSSGHVSLALLLRTLGQKGIMHVLCEGGGRLASGLLRAGLVDEMLLFVAPSILGGGNSGRAFPASPRRLRGLKRFQLLETRTAGEDAMLRLSLAGGRK